MKIKRLIRRLIEWLRGRGIDESDMLDCIEYITK